MSNYTDRIFLDFYDCPHCFNYRDPDSVYAEFYADGACVGNHQHESYREAGCGVYSVIEGDKQFYRQNLDQCEFQTPTNNTAEVQAIRMTLTLAVDFAEGYPISISSDSKYALDSICRGYAKWDQGFNSNGKNAHWDLICEIRELMEYFPSVTFYKCQAHSENTCRGNYIADCLANEAIHNIDVQGYGNGDFIR